MREAGQALMALRGYKPYSHVAIIAFLKEFFNLTGHELATFDRYRKIRHETMYGGLLITARECQQAIKFLQELFPKLESEFKQALK